MVSTCDLNVVQLTQNMFHEELDLKAEYFLRYKINAHLIYRGAKSLKF